MRLRGSLGLLFILTLNLFGGVRAYLLQPSIEQGQSATLVLSAKGESIKFPVIDQMDGFPIVSRQSRQSIELNNGVVTKQLDHYVTFYPDHNVTIPAYEVIVDGKKEVSESLLLHVSQTAASTHQEPFSFEMKVSNTTPMRHEGVKLSFIFKRNKNENLVDMRFLKPTLEGFWVKEVGKDNPRVEGDDVVHTVQYMIYPQKSGELHIVPAKIEVARHVASREMFINQIQWKSVMSNDITLHVKPLEGVDLLGEFAMDMHIDKNEIASNEALNVVLKITGEGNFDDIEPFVLNLPDATVFSDAPKVTTWMEGEKLKGEFVQKFAINAQKSFEITPLELRFYDPLKQRIERHETKSQMIKVVGAPLLSQTEKGVAKEEKMSAELPVKWHVDLYSFGLGIGSSFAVILCVWMLNRLKKTRMIPRRMHSKAVLQKLLKYQGQNEAVDRWIEKLEANLYRGGKHPIDRKAIEKLLENFV